MQFGSIPMQSNHMKQNYAAYLSNNFAAVMMLNNVPHPLPGTALT